MPYLLILTTEPGASPEKVEVDVTKPLESALGTISGVEKLSSNSAENYSIVMLEFTSDSDMDSAIVRVSAAINQVVLPEICGTPNIMEISMDMMATMYATVRYEGKDIIELTEFTDEVVVPYFERQQGVASITQMGSVTQTVEVRLNKDSVEKLNDDLIYHTNDKLLDAQKEIEKAEKEITDAIKELEAKEDELAESQSEANQGMASAMAALDQARATKAAYEATLSSLEASKKALEGDRKVYADNKMEDTYR